jgi:hypothetical protein
MVVAMLRILSVLAIAASLAITCGCSSEPPGSTFPHDPSVLSGKPFGDPPDFTSFMEKQTARRNLLMADLKHTRAQTELNDRTQINMMIPPLKMRRMELNAMLKTLDSVEQWSPEQRAQVRVMLESESQWVNESITAFLSLK